MRKTKIVSIVQDGRDKGKAFLLTEMPAYQAQKWAIRVLQAGNRGGLDIPIEVISQGMAAIGMFSVAAFLQMSWGDAEPLLDEMMECVRIIRDPNHPEMAFPLISTGDEPDIQEVETYFYLRAEVMQMHVNFSMPDAPSTSTPASPTPSPSTDSSPSTSTSPRRSVRQSPRKAPAL